MKKDFEEIYRNLRRRIEEANFYDSEFFAGSVRIFEGIAYEIIDRVLRYAGETGPGKIRIVNAESKENDSSLPYLKKAIFDCLVITEDGRKIAVEIQNRASDFRHRREGFYASKLRVMERAGIGYDEMVDVYLIIFHSDNPFRKEGLNLPLYIKECYIKGTAYKYSDGINVIRVNGEWKGNDSIGELVEAMHATSSEETSIREFKRALSDKNKERIMMKREKGFMSLAFDDYIASHREELKEDFREEIENEVRAEVKNEVRDEVLAENRERIREEVEKAKSEIAKEAKYEALNSFLDSLLAHGVNIPEELVCAVRENTPIYTAKN